MTEQEAINCLMADKEYLTDMKVCDGEEMDIAIKALKEVKQYRAIGTAKERREALEKKKMKRPLYDRSIGVLACPCCGNYLQKVIGDDGSTVGSIPSYCSRCGQRISPYWTMDE